MAKQYFEIVGPGFLNTWAPSVKWGGASDLLLGQTATRLRMGEFLEKTGNTVIRGAGLGAKPSFVYFSETGRGDIVTGGKVPILQQLGYEADTQIYSRSALGAMDADDDGMGATFVEGDALVVVLTRLPDDLTNKVYRGVRAATKDEQGVDSDTARVVGYVTRVFDDKIRFISVLR